MRSKLLRVCIGSLVGISLLAGCGGKPGDGNGSGSGSGSEGSQPKPKEPVELYLFSSIPQNMEWFDKTYGVYLREKFPHIQFKVSFASADRTIQDYVASKAPLDIVFGAYTNFHTAILETGLQSDITDLIRSHKFNLDTIEPTVVDLQRQLARGGIYGLPAYVGTSGLYYNKDIFDRFGVAYPKENMTWDELYDLAVTLTRKDGAVQYYGFANDNNTYLQVNQNSLDLINPTTLKANFTSDAWKKVVQNLARFMTIQNYDTKEATTTAFNTKGTVAMAANYTGCCGFTPGDAVTNWGVVRIPEIAGLPNVGPQVFPNYWFMSSTSKQRDTAFEVMAYIASEPFQKSLNSRGLATALKDTKLHEKYGEDLPKYKGKDTSVLFPKTYAKLSNITEYQIVASGQLNAAIVRMARDGIDINTALREAAEETDKIIQAAQQTKK
ncbi:ABC transporter substrate-binding protein [Paenibacillus hodogayensis]|uniref:ABC transporter substrate-binding protein n=1 Tax=Paenibacillus hodogayensis TaxID=279208 RepID=A0ABV5W4B2_9BACL